MALLAGCALLLALHLVLAAPMRAPIIYGDEAANLGIARFLAGRAPYPSLAPPFVEWAARYRFGYPLLVAPAWWVSGDPLTVYKLALALNAFLMTALFPLLAVWARRTFALAHADALAAAFAASLYTSFLLQPNLTWSESLLIPLIAGLLVAFQRLLVRPGTAAACAVALLAVGTYAVHERAIGLVPLTLLALGGLWLGRRLAGRAVLAAGGAALAALAATRWLDALVGARLWAGAPRYGTGEVLARLFAPEGMGNAALSLVGQVWNLTVASLLLFPLGVWMLGRTAWKGEDGAQRLAAGFTLAVAAALLATSSAFLTHFPRADFTVYGRYAEAFLAPFLVAGLAGLGGVARRHPLPQWALTLLPMLLALLLLAGHKDAVLRQVYAEMNIAGLLPAMQILGGLRLLRIAALATVAGAAVFAAGRWHPRLAAGLAGALFLAGAVKVHQTWLVPVQRAGFEARSLPVAVRALGVPEVAYDLAAARMDEFFAYQLRIGEAPYVVFDSRTAPPPSDLVISDKQLGERRIGARLVFPEKGLNQALWVRPGALQDRLARDGWLVPADPGAALPAEAECARLTALEPLDPIRLKPGGSTRLAVRLTHCGTAAPWIPYGTRDDPRGVVRFGVQWMQDGVSKVDQRSELPHVLAPGTSAGAEVVLAAFAPDGTPAPPGRYEVKVGLVQELVRWFGETRENTFTVVVTVEG